MADQTELTVPPELDGERLDKVISTVLGQSRAVGSRVIEQGVTVDGVGARASDRVKEGQVVRYVVPESHVELEPEPVPFGVLHEDASVIVVDKPPGLVVHPGSGRARGTLAAGLLHRYPDLRGVGAEGRWGLVHRLDKDTSGALLVARTEAAFRSLTADLRRRRVGRVYTALVEGKMAAPTGTVDAPIGRDPSQPTRRAVTHSGKEARTNYEVVQYLEERDLSLLEVALDTGRTHQIRVHMAAIGHPVVGDRAYGAGRPGLDPPRTFLHAARLSFDHPDDGTRLEVGSPLPGDLSSFMNSLTETDDG